MHDPRALPHAREHLKGIRRHSRFALRLVLAASLVVAGAPARAATTLPGVFNGEAYGTYANAKAGAVAASLGRSAYLPCPCNGTNGKTLTNQVDTLRAGDNGKVLKADTDLSSLRTSRDATTATNVATSTVSGLNLFNGLITASAVKAVANTAASTTAITSTSSGSGFVGLRVAGKPVATVKANTTITLAGLGKLILNKATVTGDGKTVRRITVEMLTVQVTTQNSFNLPVGAQIVVGHAASGYKRSVAAAAAGGQAFAAQANTTIGVELENKIGKAAFVAVGCAGTDGKTRTNTIATLAAKPALTLGTGDTTAFSGPSGGGTLVRTTAKVESLSLLNGLVSATTITAVAQETYQGGVRTRSTKGSGFVGLRVAGLVVPVTARPNTKLTLPGIGYVVVNEQIVPASGGRTKVSGIHIVVTTANTLKLPVGAEIIVAHAEAQALRS